MNYPTVEKPIAKKDHVKEHTNHTALEGWIGWFNIDKDTNDIITQFDKWVERFWLIKGVLKKLNQEVENDWRSLLKSYRQSFPYQTIILTYENGKCALYPIAYRVKKDGLYTVKMGWKLLWNELIIEPLYRIISISSKFYKLYEIRTGEPELRIELPIPKDGRYVVIKGFIMSIERSYKLEPGPIVAVGAADDMMEIDCWMISAHLPIQSYWQGTANQTMTEWWNMMKDRDMKRLWNQKWGTYIIEEARKNEMFIVSSEIINSRIVRNRIRFLLLPENKHCEILYSLNRQIFLHDVFIIKTELPIPAGIIRK